MKNCPCCGGPLRSGYVRTGQRLVWKEEEGGFNLPKKGTGEFYLRGSTFWDGSAGPGFYCSACDLILLPQKEEERI